MQIQTATKEELGVLIVGLRAIFIADQEAVRKRLLAQMERELLTRYGMKNTNP